MEERLEQLMENYERNDMFKLVMRVRKVIKKYRKSAKIKAIEKASSSSGTEMKERDVAHIDVPVERNSFLPCTPTDIEITDL